MKRIILFVLLVFLFGVQSSFADNTNTYTGKRQREVLSVSYTLFFNNHRFDEISIYLSTIQKDREGSLKLYDIVTSLAKNLIGDGWFRTPINFKQDFTRDIIDISIIQRKDGIQVVINREGTMMGKLFDFKNEPTDVVVEVLSRLFGSAA
ncbi:MAG: hypothetical protein AABZ11_09325 [Nitrospinota bacterium]